VTRKAASPRVLAWRQAARLWNASERLAACEYLQAAGFTELEVHAFVKTAQQRARAVTQRMLTHR
jgi:hypothetical protein